MRSIALFIPTLGAGGAERQLIQLARGLAQRGRSVVVATMYGGGALRGEAEALPGVRVVSLGKESVAAFLPSLVSFVRREDVALIYAFLTTAQLYALVAKASRPRVRLVYRIADAIRDDERRDAKQGLARALLRLGRHVPDGFIANSDAARTSSAAGVPAGRLRIVHNGIDTERFRPDRGARVDLRRHLGIGDDRAVIGLLGAFTPYKDHATFLHAAAIVRRARPDVAFLLVGDHDMPLGRAARDQARALGLETCCHFLGPRLDVERVLPACDVGCSSSATEGFPNAVCEFMATSVPCAVTDVGDSAVIVGDTGRVVPKSNPSALASALIELVDLPVDARAALGRAARRRIMDHYTIDRMVTETLAVLDGIREPAE